ncbi:26S proteasome non-ATPase regulatory subunit 9 [Chelonus insularis]|uniref:26S proteasome non-ATPase regulatory subunit 9 n=1 Tax=Chelonus insularis TaxID=460826 RepID=UPI00158E961F|nr:26S proteasome non-ATPase regulatory subunit 9 [Chelonus insularis]
MVVDMELENAKKRVLELMKQKDEIEVTLRELKLILDTNHVGMNDSLVDSEGYPRADIDVYQVRHARHKIICLQNDHKVLMKRIEEGLIEVHTISGRDNVAMDTSPSIDYPIRMEQDAPVSAEADNMLLEPFLKVNLVSSGSPAELAGIQLNDLIMEFGSINCQNFRTLKDIGDLVEQSRYKEIMIKIKRTDKSTAVLKLIPKPWSGKGLLGCNVNVIETVER